VLAGVPRLLVFFVLCSMISHPRITALYKNKGKASKEDIACIALARSYVTFENSAKEMKKLKLQERQDRALGIQTRLPRQEYQPDNLTEHMLILRNLNIEAKQSKFILKCESSKAKWHRQGLSPLVQALPPWQKACGCQTRVQTLRPFFLSCLPGFLHAQAGVQAWGGGGGGWACFSFPTYIYSSFYYCEV
jgi:hypothetical protein